MQGSSYVKSIMPVLVHNEWIVRVRFQSGAEQFKGQGARYTMQQAQVYSDAIRRDLARHGASALDAA